MKLSKREIILLTVLLVIALFFIEFRLVITPGLDYMTKLIAEDAVLDDKIAEINLNLTIAVSMEKKRNENLSKIKVLSEPFLDGVTPDSLLVFTHEMLAKHGFTPYIYTPTTINASVINPAQAKVAELTYKIKEIAREYRSLDPTKVPASSDQIQVNNADKAKQDTVLERFTIQVKATGTYDQIKSLMDEYNSLGRTIILSKINMTPYQKGLLAIVFTVDYFGLEKLEKTNTVDPINQWTRTVQSTVVIDPYIQPTPIPAATTTTTR